PQQGHPLGGEHPVRPQHDSKRPLRRSVSSTGCVLTLVGVVALAGCRAADTTPTAAAAADARPAATTRADRLRAAAEREAASKAKPNLAVAPPAALESEDLAPRRDAALARAVTPFKDVLAQLPAPDYLKAAPDAAPQAPVVEP